MTDDIGRRLQGVSHLALNSSDMARTVAFYDKLGIPLVKTMEMPGYNFQHFFFDIGNGDCLAYFWYDDDRGVPGQAGQEMFDGAMNHVAVKMPVEDLGGWRDRLTQQGVPFGMVAHGLPNPDGTSTDVSNDPSAIGPDTYAVSLYFQDPDGAQLELTAWLPAWDRVGVEHTGRSTGLESRKVTKVPYMTAATVPKPAPAGTAQSSS